MTRWLLLILLAAADCGAASWYVDNQAAGAATGTNWVNAWTNTSAIVWSSVQPGDTVYISGGSTSNSYPSGLVVGKSGTSGQPITIRVGQEDGHNGIVMFTNYIVGLDNRSYVTIDGEVNEQAHFFIQPTNTAQAIYVSQNGADIRLRYLEVVGRTGVATTANGVRWDQNRQSVVGEIAYCVLHDFYQDPISCVDGSESDWGKMAIHHNVITNNGENGMVILPGTDVYENLIADPSSANLAGHPDGIEPYGGYLRIWNNLIRNFRVTQIMVAPGGSQSTNLNNILIWNNRFVTTVTNSPSQRGIQVYFTPVGGFPPNDQNLSVSNVVIANNTFIGFPYYALYVRVRDGTYTNVIAEDFRVENNIFTGCSASDLALNIGGMTVRTGFVFAANSVTGPQMKVSYGGTVYNDATSLNGVERCSGNLTNAVTFASAPSDLHLSASDTGAIDRGVNLTADGFSTDAGGVTRTGAWDLGAYEFAQSAPVIVVAPASATVAMGGSVTFTVTATGTAPLSYQWEKDGGAIAGATSSTLTISSVTAADGAGYSVTVMNAYGSVTSPTVTLTVTDGGEEPSQGGTCTNAAHMRGTGELRGTGVIQ